MERYRYDRNEFRLIEESCIPFAVYQLVSERVVTIAVSAGFCEMFGFENSDEAIDQLDNDIARNIHPDDIANAAQAMNEFVSKDTNYNVLFRVFIDGEYKIIHAYGKHIHKENDTTLSVVWYSDEGVFTDEDKGAKSEFSHALSRSIEKSNMRQKANYDYLTGLPGMSYFFDLADIGRDKLKDNGIDVAFIYSDFCGMGRFNEKYGFAEGDKLIRAFSKILVKHFGPDNCSRLTADHFAVYTKREGLENELLDIFEEAHSMNNGKNLPVRFGVYTDNNGFVTVTTACDRAKMACDFSKKTQSSKYVFFDESMIQEIEKKRYLIEHLDEALDKNWVNLYFQPIIRAANGKVCAEEALARWNDPEKGFMIPDEFIPILEKENIVNKLDLYVVEKVLEKLKDQADRGYFMVPQTVNLSGTDFYACDMVEEIRKRVDDSGIGRDKLIVEIKESSVTEDMDFMRLQVERFQELGFQVWMDDYGGGYATTAVLQRIPFNLIKIDMQYIEQIKEDDEGKGSIVIAELIKMSMALGIETVAEGVETVDQVSFLTEVGCTMLQGTHFCKPIPSAEIFERYDKGTQIGFENPDESEYYDSLGKVNLYNLTISRNDENLSNYFDTLPMFIVEVNKDNLKIIRANRTFRDFVGRMTPNVDTKQSFAVQSFAKGPGSSLVKAVQQCGIDGKRAILEEHTSKGAAVQLFIRRIAENPVTGNAAVGVVILSVSDKKAQDMTLTYTYVARALSEDYIDLYYVNMDDDRFMEYRADDMYGNLPMERYGEDFFEAVKREAKGRIYEEDEEIFLSVFTKDNIRRHLEKEGTFNHTYRLLIDDVPTFVNLKVVPVKTTGNYIIIGINNVDAQMKQREAVERAKEEQITYARMTALSGNYIVIYTVDPVTDEYSEYSTTTDYDELGIEKRGEKFFEKTTLNSKKTIYHEDLDLFMSVFTKNNILKTITETGIFTLTYRLMLKDVPTYVSLKAAMVDEKDGPQLIIGIINIDAQVKRDQEYAHNLSAARDKANLDELTGVKNKHAYVDAEVRLNDMIENDPAPEFAIVVFDLNGLKHVNDTLGHHAGDQFIRKGCEIICKTFKHSPVYRIGGDEFVAVLQGDDYNNLEALMQEIDIVNRKNKETNDVVIAAGFGRFNKDRSVTAVFDRADARMYENKKRLKGIKD